MNGRKRATTPTAHRLSTVHDADQIVGREGQDRVLDGVLRQRREVSGVGRDLLGRIARQRHAEPPRLVERDRVPVGELERRRIRAAVGAPHRVLADPLQPGLGIRRPALGAQPRAIRIAVVATLDPAVVARRRGHRGHHDVLDADRDRVARLGPRHGHGPRHLVAAAQPRRDHRPPAAGRRVGHDVTAILHRAQHLLTGSQHAVGKRVHEYGRVALVDRGRHLNSRHLTLLPELARAGLL